jgi:hypothetical protein
MVGIIRTETRSNRCSIDRSHRKRLLLPIDQELINMLKSFHQNLMMIFHVK